MGRATSRVRLMLRVSCASGEDRGDIHIDTEVLNQIAPLAQNRRARKSHHLPIVAGIVDKRLRNLDITLIPPLYKKISASPNTPPKNSNSPSSCITATNTLVTS